MEDFTIDEVHDNPLHLYFGLECFSGKTRRTLGLGMEVTYEIMNTSVGLSVFLTMASEVLRHTVSAKKALSLEGRKALSSFIFHTDPQIRKACRLRWFGSD